MSKSTDLEKILALLRIYLNNTNSALPVKLDKHLCWVIRELGLAPVAINNKDKLIISHECQSKLQAETLNSKFWRGIQDESAKELLQSIEAKGIRVTLLKGISTSSQLYPQSYARRMSDVDLLVGPGDISNVEAVLPELGYEQRSEYSQEFYDSLHHTMPWQHTSKQIWFEIHKNLFPDVNPASMAEIFSSTNILSERQQAEFMGIDVWVMSPEFQLIYIAVHWAERYKEDISVFAFIDAAFLINQADSFDWDKVIHWAQDDKIRNYVDLFLRCLLEYGLVKDAAPLQNAIGKISNNLGFIVLYILKRQVNQHLILLHPHGRIMTVNNVAILWEHLLGPTHSLFKLLFIPWAIVFPKNSEHRFDLKFQLSRIKHLFTS